MSLNLDPNVVGKEFDRWLDWDGTADQPQISTRADIVQPANTLRLTSGLPISPISTANSESFNGHVKTSPYTATCPNDLPTPSNSSGSPETLLNSYRLSGDTLRSDTTSMFHQSTLKRKLSPSDGFDQEYKPVAGRPSGSKRPHNVIEKRYRANLNEKIAELRDSVPALRALKKAKAGTGKDGQGSSDEEDLDGLTPSHKLNKASILTKAVEYIRHLEFRTKKLEDENQALRERLQVLDKVIEKGGDSAARATAFTSESTIEQSPETKSTSSGPEQPEAPKLEVKGMIGLPDSMRKLRDAAPQEHYGHVYATPKERSTFAGKWSQRVMLGSLGALMVIEGFSESDNSDTSQKKALFGIPMEILDGWTFLRSPRVYLALFNDYCRTGGVVPLVKGFVALSILAFLVFTYMFNSKPSAPKHKEAQPQQIATSTCPALPIEVRRRAWSTSMQALALPHHSFFPEWFAVTSEWINYSLRWAIGPNVCLWLCSESLEDEAARIKAWDIAIDAQLAGGDMEVSRSRAVLTIFGSGTLPVTPLRLMMKAIHTRLVLHKVGIAGTVSATIASRIATFIANRQWRQARQIHETLHPRHPNRLPGYLNYLLQMDCDDVFTKLVTQRAYNLMYDRPTNEHAQDSLMDVIVEDHAIRTSLDAIAAWRSTSAIREALVTALQSPDAVDLLREHIQAALEIAPPGSTAETRALAVHAVLSPGRRHAFYLRAAEAVTSTANPLSQHSADERVPYFIDSSTPASARPEISTVLACAKVMLKLEQERNVIGAVELLSELKWPDLGSGPCQEGSDPSLLTVAMVYFVLNRLVKASRRACDCSSSDCEDNVHPLPQLTDLAKDLYQCLRRELLSFGLSDGQRSHLSPALDIISASWDLKESPPLSRRASNASHDTGYVSQEDGLIHDGLAQIKIGTATVFEHCYAQSMAEAKYAVPAVA